MKVLRGERGRSGEVHVVLREPVVDGGRHRHPRMHGPGEQPGVGRRLRGVRGESEVGPVLLAGADRQQQAADARQGRLHLGAGHQAEIVDCGCLGHVGSSSLEALL